MYQLILTCFDTGFASLRNVQSHFKYGYLLNFSKVLFVICGGARKYSIKDANRS